MRAARSVDKGHGRLEERRLETTERLWGYLDWPGLRQVCRIRRRRTEGDTTSTETVYAITSLSPERTDAARLLHICRRHWGIENRLHCVRDQTLEEDGCRVRAPAAAQALAALRNAALSVLRRLGFTNMKAGTEHWADNRRQLIRLVCHEIIK